MKRREFMKLAGAVGAGLLGVGDVKAAAPVVGKRFKVIHNFHTVPEMRNLHKAGSRSKCYILDDPEYDPELSAEQLEKIHNDMIEWGFKAHIESVTTYFNTPLWKSITGN